jgi:N-acetylglucosaminyldiphosphoundecaprenol N-acetyl-beta-D-mannosaminyltransferase
MKSQYLFGVRIDEVDECCARAMFSEWLDTDEHLMAHTVCTPNSEFLLAAKSDKLFARLLNDFDLNLPDGVGLRFASAALESRVIRSRVPGVSALIILAELSAASSKRLLILGERVVSEQAAANLRKQFSNLDVVAYDPGVINREGDLPRFAVDVIDEIKPAVIAVGLGQQKQESCIEKYKRRWPSVQVMIGVGGACAMIGGLLPRAPRLMQRLGLEWLWRLRVEPSRLPRIWRAVVVFPATVISTTLREGRFWRAVYRTLPEIFQQLIGR